MRITLFNYNDLNIELYQDGVSYCLPNSNDRIKVKDPDKDMYTMYALADNLKADDKTYDLLLNCFDYEFFIRNSLCAYFLYALKVPLKRSECYPYISGLNLSYTAEYIDDDYLDELCARYKRIVLPYLHKKHDEIHNPHVLTVNPYIRPSNDFYQRYGLMMREAFVKEQVELLKNQNNKITVK